MPKNLNDLLAEAISDAAPDLPDRIASDPAAYLELISHINETHQRTGEMLHAAVLAARGAGHSWDAIGNTLGISRQAAQQRFGRSASETDVDSGDQTRTVMGLTAFNEMKALQRAGRYGWHSVGYGPLYHVLERDDRQWEHRRVYAWARDKEDLEAEGWMVVGKGWFPWAYYARPTDTPALPGTITNADLLAS